MAEHISNFTDILDEEIDDSQPISLPSSNNSDPQDVSLPVQNRPPKNTGQKGNFRSIEEIDFKYRHVFTYPYFNLVQSSVIEDALYTDKSMVVCAPTGSGKTVVFEMAIVHLLMELEDKNYSDDFKIIYMAPVKALCTERLTEWYPKFNKLGLLCIEVTGDTNVEFPQLKPYRIIITTPEKWDMLTRRWKDHRSLVEVIKLFLIDEVHILNDEIRGPVLEAVVSRMKTIESSAQSAHRIEKLKAQYQGIDTISTVSEARIRFIAVSATVSNPEDVAAWLGTADRQAVYYKFGDECRPVKLKRVVEGYPCADGTSIFKFDIILNYKLWPIIQKYHNGKPTLIFCNTRKSVVLTAETLSKEITVSFSAEQKMKLTALASTIKTKKIQSLILWGIGCHHAGLLFEERMNIEHAFRNRDLPILITTTTLAMGVNLPAHLVIIKNTQQYVNGAYQEYSISTILQMVGRAGRPQYDTEATAVIMTRLQDKARYQALVGGSEPLQSYLHKRLAENLNSEAALGTVCDVAQCVQWLNSTFLSVRAARDPKRYLGLPHAAPAYQISKKIEELCVKAMNGLASAGLITMDEASCIDSTEAGRLMSVYYLDLGTMKLIMKLEGSESLERLLWLVCESHELSDMHLRVDERRCLNALNRNSAATTIRFPMKGKINSRQMKLNCIIQAVLGCLPIPDPSLNQEAMKIMRIADRVCKCLVSYVTRPNLVSQNPKFYVTILNSLILAKCISACLWENSPYVSRQLKGIGPTFSALLASAGKVSFMLLEESHPRDLERIMNKGAPAGNIIRKQITLLPKYNLTATPINERIVEIQLSLLNHAFLAENVEHLSAGICHKSYVIAGDSENDLLYFTHFKESDLINVYDGCMTFKITRKHNNEHKIIVHCISSSFVGIDEQCQYLFKDLNLFPVRIENPEHLLISKSPPKASSNIAKERKRKSQNDNEITQCKEKKKRETDLITKFKSLKESFGKTSKEIKVNLHKTAEMSNKILQNLTEPEKSLNKTDETQHTSLILSNESIQNAFQEEFDCDDFVDDKQVSDILDVIEEEIKIGENIIDATTSKDITPRLQNIQNDINCSNISYNNSSKIKSGIRKRKILNKRNNYNFIDMLEKNLKDEVDTSEDVNENGFNNAVKFQIEQYLRESTNKTSTKTNIIDLLEPFIDDQVKELRETCTKNIIVAKNTEENSKSVNDSEVSKQNNEVDISNKVEISLRNQPLFPRENESNRNINSKTVEDNTNALNQSDLQHEFIDKEDRSQLSTKIIDKSLEKVNNVFDSFTNNYTITTHLLKLPKIDSITSMYTISNHSNEFENFHNPLSVSNMNSIENSILLPKKTCLVAPNTDNNTLEKTFKDKSFKKKKIKEYMKKQSFSKTNYFETTFENTFNQRARLIGKLEVNLDVTEIVYSSSNSNNNEVNLKYCNTASVEDSECAFNYNVNENKLIINNDKNIVSIYKTNDKIYKQNTKSYNNSDNEASKDLNDKEIKLLKANPTVKDILQKYNHIVKRPEKNNIDNKQASSNEKMKEIKSLCTDVKSNRRKYRISDLDKIQVDLPESLIADSQRPAIYKTRDNILSQYTRIRNNDEVKPKIDVNFPSNVCNIDDEIVDIEDNISPELILDESTKSNLDLDISKAILNPKMLLQSISKDDTDDIIPPPPEFCDDDTSPPPFSFAIYENETNMEYDMKKSHENDQIENIFCENSEVDLTPIRENETWTLSQNIEPFDLVPNLSLSFSKMRKNLFENNNTSNFLKSRRAKLSEFKFKRKNILRK